MGKKIYARCHNCKWTWEGPANLFGKGESILISSLNRHHYENQPRPANDPPVCTSPNIILSSIKGGQPSIPTFYCLICATTTPIPHVCPIFARAGR